MAGKTHRSPNSDLGRPKAFLLINLVFKNEVIESCVEEYFNSNRLFKKNKNNLPPILLTPLYFNLLTTAIFWF